MCEICGSESRITIQQDEKNVHYCIDCHNKLLAELMAVDLPHDIPKEVTFYDSEMNFHLFALEFMLFPHCKSLKAYETGESGYKCEIQGELSTSFFQMWTKLMDRLERMMSIKYIASDGHWNGGKLLGYLNYSGDSDACDVIIDGKTYTWEEVGRIVGANEGFQIKIEIADPTDELD